MAKYICFAGALLYLLFGPAQASAVNPADLVKLKQAGVSDQVIHAVLESDAIDRAIISVDEIIAMKAAKMPDQAIVKIIEGANQSVPVLDREDAKDFALRRDIKRAEMKLELQKKELEIIRGHLSKLIINPEILKLVKVGKISSEDYADIVKYLKQYARDEDSVDYRKERRIKVDIKKTYMPRSKRKQRKALLPPTNEEVVDAALKGLRIRKDID